MTQQIPNWVIQEAEKKPRRKPGPKPKRVEPKYVPKVHVKVNLSGTVEFDLEGKEADELTFLLKSLKLDDVIGFVDPWASGAELRYDVEVTDGLISWEANETTGTIEGREPYYLPDAWRFR